MVDYLVEGRVFWCSSPVVLDRLPRLFPRVAPEHAGWFGGSGIRGASELGRVRIVAISGGETRCFRAEELYALVRGCGIGLELKKDFPPGKSFYFGECREIAFVSSGTTIRDVAVPLVQAAESPAASLVTVAHPLGKYLATS